MANMPAKFWPYEGEPSPNLLQKLNFIVDFIIDPCDAPLMVYLELAVEPAGQLALGLVGLDPVDIVKNIHQPKNLKACRKARARPGGRRAGKSWIDFDELVADMVKGEKKLPPLQWDGKKATFLGFAGAVERLAWNWYVASLVTDSVYDWMSAVYQTKYCAAKAGGRAKSYGGFHAHLSPAQDLIVPLGGIHQQTDPGWVNLGGNGNIYNASDFAFSANVQNFSNTETDTINLECWTEDERGQLLAQTKNLILGPQQSSSYQFRSYTVSGGRSWVQWSSQKGRTYFTNITSLGVNQSAGGFRKVNIDP